jgi:hypothetical protein
VVRYLSDEGVLALRCGECKRLLAPVAVAREWRGRDGGRHTHPLTRADLDRLVARGCTNPDCRDPDCALRYVCDGADHRPGCPGGFRLMVRYFPGEGVLALQCGRCEWDVACVAVAGEWLELLEGRTILGDPGSN